MLQNELRRRLPSDFVTQFPGGTGIAYAIIPLIPSMDQPFRNEVQKAFAGSLSVIWRVLICVGGLGLLASLFMKRLPLHTDIDKDWGLVVVELEKHEQKV